MLPTWFFLFALALFGLVFGSFANVVIWRFPRGESLSSPPSRCPACETPISWYDNVPIASWVVLRGRCRTCGTRISPRYPLVEGLSALLWVSAGAVFGQTWQTAFAIAFFYLLMILSFIDLDLMRLPDPLVGLTALIGLVGAIGSAVTGARLVPLTPVLGLPAAPVATAAIGALLGVGVSMAIALLYSAVRKVDGFGGGTSSSWARWASSSARTSFWRSSSALCSALCTASSRRPRVVWDSKPSSRSGRSWPSARF